MKKVKVIIKTFNGYWDVAFEKTLRRGDVVEMSDERAEYLSSNEEKTRHKLTEPFVEIIKEKEEKPNKTNRVNKAMSYREIQDIAKGLDIKANQTKGKLIDAINAK